MDDDYNQDYFTDWISQQATFFIDDNTAAYKQKGTPMFLYIAPPAPHRPATPAPQYAELFIDLKAPRTQSYGVNSTDKHWIISDGEYGCTAHSVYMYYTCIVYWGTGKFFSTLVSRLSGADFNYAWVIKCGGGR